MTAAEYHTLYGITPADLRRWVREYRKAPAFAAQVARWETVLKLLENPIDSKHESMV